MNCRPDRKARQLRDVDREPKPNTIGIISDTHGLLREEALLALKGSDLIIHAGDVGDPGIIQTLKFLAPVFAVRGNVDTEPWARALPETEVIETGPATIYVLHDAHALDLDPAAAGFPHRDQRTLAQARAHRTWRRSLPQSGKRGTPPVPIAGDACPTRSERKTLESSIH